MSNDQRWMNRALELARRGRGKVHPNPMVGAVLVKGNRLLAEGFHARYGESHAEVMALEHARNRTRGATLYVSLEPCAHWGKTPPCVQAVMGSGVSRVVAAMRDPFPLVAGKGFAALRKAGIKLTTGVLEAEARELNRAFITRVTQGRPYVTLKAAASLDGKIATSSGESRWITSPEARTYGHSLRVQADAIAVGSETIRRDNPELSAHGQGRNPGRIIFDSRLTLSANAKVFNSKAPTWVVTTGKAPAARRRLLEQKGISVLSVGANRDGRVDVKGALVRLSKEGITHLLVEGGGSLHASFLEAGVVDEIYWFMAPTLIGGVNAKPAIGGHGVKRLSQAWGLENIRIEQVGKDFCFHAQLQKGQR